MAFFTLVIRTLTFDRGSLGFWSLWRLFITDDEYRILHFQVRTLNSQPTEGSCSILLPFHFSLSYPVNIYLFMQIGTASMVKIEAIAPQPTVTYSWVGWTLLLVKVLGTKGNWSKASQIQVYFWLNEGHTPLIFQLYIEREGWPFLSPSKILGAQIHKRVWSC